MVAVTAVDPCALRQSTGKPAEVPMAGLGPCTRRYHESGHFLLLLAPGFSSWTARVD
jgi:hypothetical protein